MSEMRVSLPHLVPIADGDEVRRGPKAFADFLERNSGGYRVVENPHFRGTRPYAEYANAEDLNLSLDKLYSRASSLGTGPIFFGGEHTVTFHLVSFLLKRFDSLCLLIFDAHSDCQGDDNQLHNWNFLRKLKDAYGRRLSVIHVGFRDVDERDLEDFCDEVLHIDTIARQGLEYVQKRIESLCTDRQVHISVDVDVLDPLMFQSVKSPISGGLLPVQIISILRALAGQSIVSADIVEFSANQPSLMEMLLLADLFYSLEKLCGHKGNVPRSNADPI